MRTVLMVRCNARENVLVGFKKKKEKEKVPGHLRTGELQACVSLFKSQKLIEGAPHSMDWVSYFNICPWSNVMTFKAFKGNKRLSGNV